TGVRWRAGGRGGRRLSRTLGESAARREQASHHQSESKEISAETLLRTHWHASHLAEEEGIEVGTMDLRVAHRARLILAVLVVERWRAGRLPVHIGRMTTQAKKVDVVDLEQTRIGGAMRGVARQAAFVGLHRSVFEDERPHGVGVTFGADGELTGGSAHLVAHLCSVRIMTIAALYEPDIDAVPIRPGELGFLCSMAPIAQGGLRLHQQEIDIGGAVRTVTIRAADAIRQVFGLRKVCGFQAGLVTLRADRCGFDRTQLLKANDLGEVPAAVHVGLRRTVTALASMLVAFEQRRMRSISKVLVPNLLMARLANVSFGVLACSRAGQRGGCLRIRFT